MAKHADTPDRQLSESTAATTDGAVDEQSCPDDDLGAHTDTVPAAQADIAEDTDGEECSAESDKPDATAPSRSGMRLALALGTAVVFALGGLGGWLGYRGYQGHQAQKQRELFVEVARQSALNLTTISYAEADADVQRILDSATGRFYDDFQQRSKPFVEIVRQAQSKSVGTITGAGLESVDGDKARVLVAVHVTTSNVGAADQPPRAWRMRIDVQKVGDGAKVFNVEFVP